MATEAKIILPLYDNDGIPLLKVHNWLRHRLLYTFGGYTQTKGEGAWKDDIGTIFCEDVAVYTVYADDTQDNVNALRYCAKWVAREARQHTVYVRWFNGMVSFEHAYPDTTKETPMDGLDHITRRNFNALKDEDNLQREPEPYTDLNAEKVKAIAADLASDIETYRTVYNHGDRWNDEIALATLRGAFIVMKHSANYTTRKFAAEALAAANVSGFDGVVELLKRQ